MPGAWRIPGKTAAAFSSEPRSPDYLLFRVSCPATVARFAKTVSPTVLIGCPVQRLLVAIPGLGLQRGNGFRRTFASFRRCKAPDPAGQPSFAREREVQVMRDPDHGPGATARPYQPSPRDIRQACASIQKTWTERERRKRSGMRLGYSGWMPPSVVLDSLTDAADEASDSGSPVGGAFSRDAER